VSVVAVAVSGRGLADPGEPVFHADDDALLRGRAAFETMRVYDGRPFMLGRHLERLGETSARLGLPQPDTDECARLARLVVDGHPDVALRLFWTGRDLVAIASTIDPKLERQRENGIQLAVVRWSTGALAGAKSTSYAENMRAFDDAVAHGADDALLVSADGIVLEAPTANVWWRSGDRLFTPTLGLPILAGVTRSVVKELAEQEVVEGVFPLEELLAADEVFLTASVREVMPVAGVDGTVFSIGPAAKALQAALRSRT